MSSIKLNLRYLPKDCTDLIQRMIDDEAKAFDCRIGDLRFKARMESGQWFKWHFPETGGKGIEFVMKAGSFRVGESTRTVFVSRGHQDPSQVDDDPILVRVRADVDRLMRSLDPHSLGFYNQLRVLYPEASVNSDFKYVSMWDSDSESWITVCVESDKYQIPNLDCKVIVISHIYSQA